MITSFATVSSIMAEQPLTRLFMSLLSVSFNVAEYGSAFLSKLLLDGVFEFGTLAERTSKQPGSPGTQQDECRLLSHTRQSLIHGVGFKEDCNLF